MTRIIRGRFACRRHQSGSQGMFVARAMPDRCLEVIVVNSTRRTAIVLPQDTDELIPLLLAATEAEALHAEKRTWE